MILRVAVVTNVVPHYRAAFYERLFRRDDLDVHVFCQAAIPGMNLETVHDRFGDRVTVVSAIGLPRERLNWQWLPWGRLLTSFDVLFVQGSLRVVSGVLLASLARLMGKRVVLWGHAHTAHGGAWTERMRLGWWRCFKDLFVYADGEVRWLRDRGFATQRIQGMNNGLDQRQIDATAGSWSADRLDTWRRENDLGGRILVLSCARLEPKNRFDVWLEAMPAVVTRVPNLLWCAIGDGRERAALGAQARRLGLERHVRWLGTILDERDIAPWFLSSQALVHPDAIGLTLLHAFGYGLPVVTHGDPAAQMPEFHAFTPGKTGLVFQRGDAASLAEAVCRCLDDDVARRQMGDEARRVAREDYNVDIMAERFVSMAVLAASAG